MTEPTDQLTEAALPEDRPSWTPPSADEWATIVNENTYFKNEIQRYKEINQNKQRTINSFYTGEGVRDWFENIIEASSVGIEDDGESVVITLEGITIDDNDDQFVKPAREFDVSGTITFTFNFTVYAKDEDDARDEAYRRIHRDISDTYVGDHYLSFDDCDVEEAYEA